MEYLIGSRNGGCPDPFTTLESANAAAKEMSIADPTEWFDVINEDAEVLYAWHDGKAYNPVDDDDDSSLADMYPLEIN